MVGGSKEKQTNAEKGGEGVQNPGNFADVLYVWSLRKLSEYPMYREENNGWYVVW